MTTSRSARLAAEPASRGTLIPASRGTWFMIAVVAIAIALVAGVAIATGTTYEPQAPATGPTSGVVLTHQSRLVLAPALALGARSERLTPNAHSFAPTPDLPRVAGEGDRDASARAHQDDAAALTRFTYVDVLVDSGDAPLAAYQLDVRAVEGDVRIVGIEGGESRVFADPPHYDPAAMMNDRVIIAAFSLAADDDLPRGQTRIARLHIQVVGDAEPRFEAEITVAGDANAQKIPADVILQLRAEQT